MTDDCHCGLDVLRQAYSCRLSGSNPASGAWCGKSLPHVPTTFFILSRMPASLHPLQDLCTRGYHAFPCKEGGKEPLVQWQRYQSAPPDGATVQSWVEKFPSCNVAIVTGQFSNLLVIDVDGTDGAISAAKIGIVGHQTVSVHTGNGWHYYFRYPTQYPAGIIRSRVRFLPGLDVRAEGGYVIAPPSLHPNGQRYGWYDFTRDKKGIPQELPEYLYQIIAGKDIIATYPKERKGERERERGNSVGNATAYGLAALKREQGKILRANVGERNVTVNTAACKIGSLVGAGLLPEWEAAQALLDAAVAAGLPQREANATIASGLAKGKQHPRQVTVSAHGR